MASSSSPSLSHRLAEYVAAAFTGLWVQSHEHEDALAEIGSLCRERGWALASWDVDQGLRLPGQEAGASAGSTDPLAAIKSVNALVPPLGSRPPRGEEPTASSALLVLVNFHRFMSGAEVVQALAHQVQRGKQNRTFLIILSPVVQIPVELEKQFVVLEHDLPDRGQLEQVARSIATEPGEVPEQPPDLDRLLDAACGLTRHEAEGAFSLSLARHGRLDPRAVWELKEQMLKKSGLLQLHRGTERFVDLGGLDALKAFCLRALAPRERRDGVSSAVARPRGVLLLSPPGCGKSLFCKALGNETGRPTLVLDVGALMGSLVGQTEENTRRALRTVDASAPCILFLDEVEKALAGVAGSGQSDSGVSSRLFGTLLTYLSDHTSDVFVVMTANDVSRLPPEMTRAERFDAVFYLDVPGTAERSAIWPIHLQRYGLREVAGPTHEQRRPDDHNWTGAEIAACCRLAALLGVPLREAAQNVVPVAVTAAESVERLRAWAAGRCLSASHPGVYARGTAEPPASTGRRVARPSPN